MNDDDSSDDGNAVPEVPTEEKKTSESIGSGGLPKLAKVKTLIEIEDFS